MSQRFCAWYTQRGTAPPVTGSDAVFDISPDYDQCVFTGADGFERSVSYVEKLIGRNKDILLRRFTLAGGKRAALLAVDGMCDKQILESSVILAARKFSSRSEENKFEHVDGTAQLLGSSELSKERSLSKAYLTVLSGDAALIVDGESECYIIGVRAVQSRSVGESPNEGSIRGPHEAFTENIRTNTALLRRRITDPNLTIESLSVGARSHTSVALCYIRGLTDRETVEVLRERIEGISTDILGDSGKLEQLLERHPLSLFPQSGGTELTDAAALALMNGRTLIIVNGSPYVLILPVTAAELMSVSEDSYRRWIYAGPVRLLRWAAAVIAVLAPAVYVAIISYHPGMLPTNLLLLTSLNRVNVPFSALAEVMLIELSLEILREASTRMPQKIGSALSIVGGIIIGDATIKAGLVSPLLIITAGISTLCFFVIPSYSFSSSLRLIKYLLIICSAVLGIFGLTAGCMLVLSRFVCASDLGVPFSHPFAPFHPRFAISSLFQVPERLRRLRDKVFSPSDTVRSKE